MANSKAVKADKMPVNPVPGGKKLSKTSYTLKMMKRTWGGYFMILPFTVCFIAFTMIPVILSILLSFTDFNMLEWPSFRGFDNYIRLFLEDDLFMTAFQNTIIFAVATGPASFIISFILAWFINELSPKARSFVTFIFYAPSISGGAYLIWQLVFKEDIYGYANGWLMSLGLITEPIAYFKDVNYIVPLCIMIQLWSSLGTGFLANIAGLQGVDRSLYEAGSIDGIKNRWQEAWYITLPQMKDILLFGAVLAITGAFGFGGVVDALCGNPSTDYVAWTLSHHLGEYMGQRFEFGYASAISIVLFFLMAGMNMVVQKLLEKVGQ